MELVATENMCEFQAPLPRKLWEHPDPKSTAMWKFMQDANSKHGLNMQVSDILD